MKLRPGRQVILALALVASVVLSLQALFWSPQSGGAASTAEIVQPVVRASVALPQAMASDAARPRAPAGETGRPDDLLQIRKRQASRGPQRDLFESYRWLPPPPPSPAPITPPPPTAPPLPFTYAGRIEMDERQIFLLLQGERVLRVVLGDSVGEFELTASGPSGLVFLHKPTALTQTLNAPGVPVASYSP